MSDGPTSERASGGAAGREWPMVLDEVTNAVDALTATLSTEDDFAVLLHGMCVQVVAAVPGVDEATITVLRDGYPRTAAATSDLVADLDRDQYAGGDGPCIRAARTGRLVRVSVADAVGRWPVFARDTDAAGFGSVMSAPLVFDGDQSAAVNCYSVHGHGFADLDEKLVGLFTSAAAAALCVHARYILARDNAESLRVALTNRAVIDQAKGILMAIRGITADQAFTLLVEQSQRDNVKLRDLAVQFVVHATGVRPV